MPARERHSDAKVSPERFTPLPLARLRTIPPACVASLRQLLQQATPAAHYSLHYRIFGTGPLNRPKADKSHSTSRRITTTLRIVLIGGAIGTYVLMRYSTTPTITKTTMSCTMFYCGTI